MTCRNNPYLAQNLRHGFRLGCADSNKLSDVLHKMDEPSLSKLVRDHECGKLEQIGSPAA
jgi:hypothetical protein